MDFYTGCVLRVDLSSHKVTREPLNLSWADLYVGGKGLLLRYLFDELPTGADPWSPENPLILATGPFAGTAVATCSRLAVGCKSPLTGALVDSYVGGSFAPELKYAGYDLVILQGRSPEPVLLCIDDDRVEFLPAVPDFWGLRTSELEELVRQRMGPHHKVLSIGPGGENCIPFACLSTDQYHKAGRGGVGAIMGSKQLKAIAVRGTGYVSVGDARAFAEDMLRIQNERVLTVDNEWAYEQGTPMMLDLVNAAGALPTRDWQTGAFEGAESINSEALLRRRTKVRACAQCPIACRQFHAFADHECEGPEYETLGVCGANCGMSNLDAVAAFNRECDELGLDTISTGAVVALAMGLHDKGIADHGLRFGEPKQYVRAPGLIADRSGEGADLALGAQGLATKHALDGHAAQVKNLDMPAYDPRGLYGMALAYATSDRGACHMRAFAADEELFGDSPPDTLEGKAQHVIDLQNFNAVAWTGVWCANMALDADLLAQHFRHLWKRDVEAEELLAIGDRVWNLGRLLNVREGLGSADDMLPRRLLTQPHPSGAAEGNEIGEAALRRCLREYYSLRGWTGKGVPTEKHLLRAGVDVRLEMPTSPSSTRSTPAPSPASMR